MRIINRENHMYTTIAPDLEQPLTEEEKYMESIDYIELYNQVFYEEYDTFFEQEERNRLQEILKNEPIVKQNEV